MTLNPRYGWLVLSLACMVYAVACEAVPVDIAPSADQPLGGLTTETLPPLPTDMSSVGQWAGWTLAALFAWLAPQPRLPGKDTPR